jgi:hypothetical protein
MPNTPRTAEEKRQQRAAADARRDAGRQRRSARVNAFREARAVACDALGLKYKPIAAPQSQNDFGIATAPVAVAEDWVRRWRVAKSWEILTEARSAGG